MEEDIYRVLLSKADIEIKKGINLLTFDKLIN